MFMTIQPTFELHNQRIMIIVSSLDITVVFHEKFAYNLFAAKQMIYKLKQQNFVGS